MFTGIVEEKGTIRYIQLTGESGVLAVKAKKVLEGTKIGDSIAVNGICLALLQHFTYFILNVNYSVTELPEHLKSGGIPSFFRVRP